MHAAIDVIIRRSHIHHCTRGIWLDWQAQGTRVSQNLFHDNTLPYLSKIAEPDGQVVQDAGEDLFIEVSHGPTLIDHNLFLSAIAMKLATQGIAVVHNLIAGSLVSVGIGTDNGAKTLPSPRFTPYHVPHCTEIAGFMTFLHGDARFYNNVFVQQKVHPVLRAAEAYAKDHFNCWNDGCVSAGTMRYDGYPTFEEWDREFEGYCGMGSAPSDRYYMHLPVWAKGNAYFNGAQPWEKERDCLIDAEHTITLYLKEDKNGSAWTLETNLYDFLPLHTGETISTATLGMAFEPEQKFEAPDGLPIVFQWDNFDSHRSVHPTIGPFEDAEAAKRRL